MRNFILIVLAALWSAAASPCALAASPNTDGGDRVFSIGTNLLYDALAVPNISAEYLIHRRWTVDASWMYGWWDVNRTHRYWRIYGGRLGGRYWLGTPHGGFRPMTGHHLGAYAAVFTYDFEWGGTGYMAGKPGGNIFDRASYAVGVEYGYTLPLNRNLSLDFSIDLGYSGGKYIVYKPEGSVYVWQSTRQRRWWGPTGVSVTLSWCLNKVRPQSATPL